MPRQHFGKRRTQDRVTKWVLIADGKTSLRPPAPVPPPRIDRWDVQIRRAVDVWIVMHHHHASRER